MLKYAPFVVPTLSRSVHFIRMVESLKKNSWARFTDVIVGVDYPPSEKHEKGWKEICDYLEEGDFSAFNKLVVIRHTENVGASNNLSQLHEYVYQHYDRWIYCDDDCEFSPNFLEYIDKCLDAFDDDPDVVAVAGYSYPIDWKTSDEATCMKQQFNAATWGLGRWVKKSISFNAYIKSGNMLDDADMVIHTRRYRNMVKKCFTQYINSSSTGRESANRYFLTHVTDLSLRAYLACQDKYCISPVLSKVRNHGFDGSGVYCQNSDGTDTTRAYNYNYQQQEIDSSDHFDIVLNDQKLHECNRKRLDGFENVSKTTYFVTYIKFLIIKYFGVSFARKADRTTASALKLLKFRK